MQQNIRPIFDHWAYTGRDVETGTRHEHTFKSFLRRCFFKKEMDCLDLGCGNGWGSRVMASKWWCKSMTGVDISELMIRSAMKKSVDHDIQFEVSDILKYTPQKSFDLVFSMECLYYLQNPIDAFHKIYEWLNPGGLFIFASDCYDENPDCYYWENYVGCSIQVLSKKAWRELFEKAGFTKIKTINIQTQYGNPDWSKSQETFFVIAQKP